jgi:hypothetical protein
MSESMDVPVEAGIEMPHVLFFVRHFNDVDHLMPVAFKLSASNRARPIVVVTEPLYDIKKDYLLRFLQTEHGIPVTPIFQFHPVNPLVGWLAGLLGLPFWGGFMRQQRALGLSALRKFFFGKKWAENVLDRYHPKTLIFEWGSLPNRFGEPARQRGIPSISLPHGMSIWTNELANRQEQLDGRRPTRDYVNLFDRVVHQSRLHAARSIEEGIDPGKIAVLGSTRYCLEWQRINLAIQPVRFLPQKGQGCTYRAVFMLPQWAYNSDLNLNLQALRRLSGEPWLHLVLKPHTREVDAVPEYLKELNTLPNVEVASAIGSVALIEWADAVIVVGSSIALEVLLQGKPHLDPAFLGENTTVFQESRSEWMVNDDNELVDALKRLSAGDPPPYGEEQVSAVVRQLVLGDSSDDDVLKRYADFVMGGWVEFPTYKDLIDAPGE